MRIEASPSIRKALSTLTNRHKIFMLNHKRIFIVGGRASSLPFRLLDEDHRRKKESLFIREVSLDNQRKSTVWVCWEGKGFVDQLRESEFSERRS